MLGSRGSPGSRSSANSSIATFSASMTLNGSCTSPGRWPTRPPPVAQCRRGSAAVARASRRVSRKAGSPVWRWAVPSPMARSTRVAVRGPCSGRKAPAPDVVAESVSRCEGGKCGIASLTGITDGLGRSMGWSGMEPVPGQFAHAAPRIVATQFFQGFRHLSVRSGPAGGTEVLVQGVLDEGMEKLKWPGASASSRTKATVPAASRNRERHPQSCLVATAKRSRSKSRPITAATDNTAQPPSRAGHPGTDHLADLSGKAVTSREASASHRPSTSA